MAVATIKLNNITPEFIKNLEELSVTLKSTQFDPSPESKDIMLFDEQRNVVCVPYYWYNHIENKKPACVKPKSQPIDLVFGKKLFTAETDPSGRNRDQDVVYDLAIKRLLSCGSVLLSCHTGYGKSALMAAILCRLKRKTIVLCHLNVVKTQLAAEIIECTGGKAKVQIMKGTKVDPSADVCILGMLKASRVNPDLFSDFGTLVMDELHLCSICALTKAVFSFRNVEYLIGLSATPDRTDGFHKAFDFYFGKQKENIVREEKKPFVVMRKWTNYKPEVDYIMIAGGKTVLDWTHIINSLADIDEINIDCCDEITNNYPSEKIIVLCERKRTVTRMYELLKEKGESVDFLVGSKQGWDKSKRVLVSGVKKGGVGLNDPSLTMLILMCDLKDVRQCEGRIRTKNNKVLDYRHDFSTLDNHGKERDRWYAKKGATFVDLGKPRTKREVEMARSSVLSNDFR